MIFLRIFIISFGFVFAGSSLHAMEMLDTEKIMYDLAIITAITEQHKTSLDKCLNNFATIKTLEQNFSTKLLDNAPIEELAALEQHKLQLQKETTPLCISFLGSLKEVLEKNPGMYPDLYACVDSLLQTGLNVLDKTPQVNA